MRIPTFPIFILISLIFASSCFALPFFPDPKGFIKCLGSTIDPVSSVAYIPSSPLFNPIYNFSMRNPRFPDATRTTPAVIVRPTIDTQVPAIVKCAKTYSLQLRTRSGGHDFEGISYASSYDIPFVLLDMYNIRNVTVDPKAKTAIVQAGATLGEVYYYIYNASGTLAFPAGVWSTVGATGLICGGGYGPLRRKYGFAADNVLDVRMVDVNGRILTRKTMGEDLFWAIRGGGCSSFGVILSWKLNLVDVPKLVTMYNTTVILESGATDLVYEFQNIGPNLPIDHEMRLHMTTIESDLSSRPDKKTVLFTFAGLYFGPMSEALPYLQKVFPALGLKEENFMELPWIDVAMLNSFFPLYSTDYKPEDLLNRSFLSDIPTKVKSDFTRKPITKEGLDGLWQKLLEVDIGDTTVIFTPYGGVLDNYPESSIPYPNRKGTLYKIYTRVWWRGDIAQKLKWIRSVHDYLTPHVSSNPRRAYSNYDDLDLGSNPGIGIISNIQASKWGKPYFAGNWEKLIQVKTLVDPLNFFRHEQSIPPFSFFSEESESAVDDGAMSEDSSLVAAE